MFLFQGSKTGESLVLILQVLKPKAKIFLVFNFAPLAVYVYGSIYFIFDMAYYTAICCRVKTQQSVHDTAYFHTNLGVSN